MISRRVFLASAALPCAPILWGQNAKNGPARRILPLDRDWLFGGKFSSVAVEPGFNDAAFTRVTLPHCVTPLSWENWDPAKWEDIWIYRRHFGLSPEFRGMRLFLHFDRVMIGATPTLNGHALPEHLGGYLPFEYEITSLANENTNVLAVAVDSRWKNVPPEGSPRGPISVDYFLPGGIIGSVSLRAAPQVFIRDVFAKPVDPLSAGRRVEVACSIDAAAPQAKPVRIDAELRDGARVLARATKNVDIERAGVTDAALTLAKPGNVKLWEIDDPRLYDVAVTLSVNGRPVHDYRARIGFRDARFEVDGFFLNGRRRQIFGLNRHELYPYVGYAMPARVQRRDAETIRRDFNCNFVRCSHYPQSEAFLDACDELGLMVWQEPPGWGYLSDDPAWQELVVRDVRDMIRRDRNHPSIVIWGVRVNESKNNPALYSRTKADAKALDGTRPTSGTMTRHSTEDWLQDVFAFDDYHAEGPSTVGIRPPIEGVPYLVSEAVGQFNYFAGKNFDIRYRRAGDVPVQVGQALFHAQAHSKAAAYPRCAGVVAWCAFDYGSLVNPYQAVKCPGVADIFRIPKLGASFYLAQGDPATRPVIEPDFYWDFGPKTPSGPGDHAPIFSNCDRLEIFLDGKPRATLTPDQANYPHIKHPPFFADLRVSGKPALRIDGYIGDTLALSRSFSADPAGDQLLLHADDAEILGDGIDATRVVFRAADKFGAPRPFVTGEVALEIAGPGAIVGDNPFSLDDSGGVGAVWIKAAPGASGRITVKVRHATLGAKSVEISVRPSGSRSPGR